MAKVDYFLKLEGIDGESVDKEFARWIDITSWSWGVSNSGTTHVGGGAGAGKANVSDFSFTTQFSAAAAKLFLTCATGKHIPSALITGRNDRTGVFLKIKLTDVLVTSYQTGASADNMPTDSSSLNFAKIEFQDAEFDIRANEG